MSLRSEAAPGCDFRGVGRAGALIAAAAAISHLAGSVTGSGHSTTMLVTHLVMAASCVTCALCLWHRPATSAWAMSLIMGIVMVVVHVWMMPPALASGGHQHGAGFVSGHVDGFTAAGLALAVLEVSVAAWVLTVQSIEEAA